MPRQFRRPVQPFLRLSIVIPAYNEEQRLPATLGAIRQFLIAQRWEKSVEILVADDGSQDGTVALVQRLMTHWPLLRVIALPHSGKGGALRGGVMAARGNYIFLCDADLSMPITELPKFLPPFAGPFDILIGSREAPGAERINEPTLRHTMSRVFNTFVRVSVLPGISDTQCGFKCLKRDVAHHLFSELSLSGFGFDVELLALARLRGYTIAEVPIRWVYGAESRVRPVRDTIHMAQEVFTVRLRIKHLAENETPDELAERLRQIWEARVTEILPTMSEDPERDLAYLMPVHSASAAEPQEIVFWTMQDTQEIYVISLTNATELPEHSSPSAWSRTGELPAWMLEQGEETPTAPRPVQT